MDLKLSKILKKIGISENNYNEFSNAKLSSVNVDDLNNVITIKIENNNDVSYNLFQELVNKFKTYFEGTTINLSIINNSLNSNHFKEYFDKFFIEDNIIPNIDILVNKNYI